MLWFASGTIVVITNLGDGVQAATVRGNASVLSHRNLLYYAPNSECSMLTSRAMTGESRFAHIQVDVMGDGGFVDVIALQSPDHWGLV